MTTGLSALWLDGSDKVAEARGRAGDDRAGGCHAVTNDSAESPLSRRQALALMVAAVAGGAGAAQPGSTTVLRAIPSSGETIPAVGLGTYRAFDVGASGPQREPLREVLRRFVAAGGRVVDSSPMYGAAETVVGDLAAELGLGGSLFVATKVWTSGREAGIEQMEQSMRRLRVTRLDLMQIHNLLDWRTHLKTLRDWKEAGRVRYIGITHYTASAYGELERILRDERLDFVQLNYSLAEREAERRLLPLTRERGIAVLVNRPYAEGALFRPVRGRPLPSWAADIGCRSWGQFFLKWILGHPAVTSVIPATSQPDHLDDNMQAGVGLLPDTGMRERMAAYIQTL
jgi:diketogulonate reductase-like aldo/keto reductase